mmetsp:Transcript_27379/g.65702  ORF Transcript_27379/g.65702 Transcript_27379/m.65702 type:complete len:96 (+) Transcript_27379:2553-2840(+)
MGFHLHVSPPCEGFSGAKESNSKKTVVGDFDLHVSPPCEGFSGAKKSNSKKTVVGDFHLHVSPPCEGFSGANRSGGNNAENDTATEEVGEFHVSM